MMTLITPAQERWRQLQAQEDWAELLAFCNRKVERFETQISVIEEHAKIWRKRACMARDKMEEG